MYPSKTLLLASLVVALLSCGTGNNSTDIASPIITAKKDTVKVKEAIVGERIDGPANIRNTVNG